MSKLGDRDHTVASGKGVAVTPSDGSDLSPTARALYVGTGGTVIAILDSDTTSLTFTNIPNGSLLPLRVRRVLATGTTASGLIALY